MFDLLSEICLGLSLLWAKVSGRWLCSVILSGYCGMCHMTYLPTPQWVSYHHQCQDCESEEKGHKSIEFALKVYQPCILAVSQLWLSRINIRVVWFLILFVSSTQRNTHLSAICIAPTWCITAVFNVGQLMLSLRKPSKGQGSFGSSWSEISRATLDLFSW